MSATRGNIKTQWQLKSKSGKAMMYQGRGHVVRPVKMGSYRLKGMMATKESGYVDTAVTGALDTTGTVALINTIAQGTSVVQRVGKKVLLKSVQVRGNAIANSAAIAQDVAWMIVYDKRPTGSLPAITDILVSASATAMNNDNNSGRFVILKRSDFAIVGNVSAAANTTDSTLVDTTCFISLKGLPTVYKAATTGAIADIEEGALYYVAIGTAAAGTSAATHNYNCRVRFLDF